MQRPTEPNAVEPSAPDGNSPAIGQGMRLQVAQYDWASTALGRREDWPSHLNAIVNLMMDSVEPMVLWWGDESIQIYNDAYAPRVTNRDGQSALGLPAWKSWQHGWESVKPLVGLVLNGGPSTVYSDFLFPIERDGWFEDTFWTYSFTPVRDDVGAVVGVLLLSEETTQRKLALRRHQILDLLRTELSNTSTVDEVNAVVERTVGVIQSDIRKASIIPLRLLVAEAEIPRGVIAVTAPAVGVDVDLAVVFEAAPKIALNASYSRFLEEFTLLVANARHRVDSEALRRTMEAERDRLLLDAPVGAAVMLGDDLVYHLVNSIYADVSGRPAAAMVGKPFVEVFPELNGSPVHEQFKAVYHAGHPFVSQPTLVQIHRNGGALDDRYFTYNLSPLRTLDGQVYGLMVIAVDITVEVESRVQVEKLNAELQAAARAKDEFLALLGHELRNPLSPIVTALDLMRLRDHATEREHTIIRRQVAHLTRLVDDLLDVSRITRGKVELRPEEVDVKEVLTNAVEMVTPLVAQRQQQLSVEVVAARWYGDTARLAQIASNLLTNASRYSQTGAEISLHATATETELTIVVTDNGMGITAEMLPRIFEPFIQGERNVQGSVGGLGIGLALVKNLAELHGGNVVAVSEGPGKGSTFTVRLPILPPTPTQPAAKTDPVLSSRPHQHILVVDDNVDAADTLADALRTYGHEVTVAYTASAALQIGANQLLDLAILDIGLPDMTGHELARLMRETGRNTNTRYAALTGFGQEADKDRSAAAGFAAHLVKPLKLEDLEKLLAIAQ